MKPVNICIIMVGLLIFAGCQKSQKELYVYNWADYMAPEVLAKFEQQFKCKIILDTFDSNESMYAKLKAGASGYDIIFPSTYKIKLMADQNMIQPLDHSLLPNLKNIDSTYKQMAFSPDLHYSVPYALSITAVAYLKNRVADVIPSWNMFERKDLRGRITMLDDHREVIGAALMFNGYDINSVDSLQLLQAEKQVIQWKKNLAKFENEQYKTGLASGEFFMVQGYSGDILQICAENPDIGYFVPAEGASLAMDEIVIAKDARNVKLAHHFINFLLDSQIAAENTEYIGFLCPNQAAYALLSAELLQNPILFPPEQVRAHLQVIRDLGVANSKYTETWDRIKSAQ
jgi:spermidine/putrescine transport system substrate-binding protein